MQLPLHLVGSSSRGTLYSLAAIVRSAMKTREWVVLIVISVGIGLFWTLLPDFLGGLVDAAWWDVLPWVLLALLWIGFGIWAWRNRRGADSREPGSAR